jgi:hypothetical protein
MRKITNVGLLLMIVYLLFLATFSWAANKLLYEDFDDQSLSDTSLTCVLGGSLTPLSAPDDFTWATGRGGSGHAIYFRLSDDRDSVLWWRESLPNPWPTD